MGTLAPVEQSPSSFERRFDQFAIRLAESRWTALMMLCIVGWTLIQYSNADPDLFARFSLGKLTWISGHVVTQDPFAFTETRPSWMDHEWFAGWAFFQVLRFGGDAGIFLLKLLMGLASVAVLWHAHRLRWGPGSPSLILFPIAMIMAGMAWQSPMRAQAFTYLFLSLFLLGFVLVERCGRPMLLLIAAPLLMPFWTNVHAGFVVGLGFLGLFTANLFLRRSPHRWSVLVALLLAFVGTAINPYGAIEHWKNILEGVTMKRPFVLEWGPLNPLSGLAVVPNVFAVLILTGLGMRLRGLGWGGKLRVLARYDVLIVLMSMVQMYRHVRFIPLFMITAIVFGGDLMPAMPRFAAPYAAKAARVLVILLVALQPFLAFSMVRFLVSLPEFKLSYAKYPQQAVDWLLSNRTGGKVAVEFTVGSYVFYRVYPRFQVSIDGRYEAVYTDDAVKLAMDVVDSQSATRDQSLEKMAPDFVLRTMDAKERPYPKPWRVIYRDDRFAIWSREAGTNVGAAGPVRPHDWSQEAAPWPVR